MATDKKGFVLYSDLIHTVDKMNDLKAGKLFKTILRYVNDQNPLINDDLVDLVFEPIKQQLKRDLKKYEGIKQKRSEAGIRSAEIKKQQNSTKSTSVESVQQTSTNSTVIVNDTVTDTVKDNVNDTVTVNVINDKREVALKVFFKDSEIDLLKMEFKEDYEEAVSILSNYKNAKGVEYDSDYHAMHGWVKNRIRENKIKMPVKNQSAVLSVIENRNEAHERIKQRHAGNG